MTLDFNQTSIINQTLDVNKKEEYVKKLISLQENTKEKEIIDSIESLIDKISYLTEAEFEKLYTDRNLNKIFSFPAYYL